MCVHREGRTRSSMSLVRKMLLILKVPPYAVLSAYLSNTVKLSAYYQHTAMDKFVLLHKHFNGVLNRLVNLYVIMTLG